MPSAFAATTDGWPYIAGNQNASLIDDYALELANKLDAVVPFAASAGIGSLAAGSITAGSVSSVAITFPVGRFTQPPIVSVTLASTAAGTVYLTVRAFGITTTGATLYVYNTGTATATFASALPLHWTAIQMATGSAAG